MRLSSMFIQLICKTIPFNIILLNVEIHYLYLHDLETGFYIYMMYSRKIRGLCSNIKGHILITRKFVNNQAPCFNNCILKINSYWKISFQILWLDKKLEIDVLHRIHHAWFDSNSWGYSAGCSCLSWSHLSRVWPITDHISDVP